MQRVGTTQLSHGGPMSNPNVGGCHTQGLALALTTVFTNSRGLLLVSRLGGASTHRSVRGVRCSTRATSAHVS